VPPGKDVVVIDGAGAMVIVRSLDAVMLLVSIAVTVKLAVPAAVGVPVMSPVLVLRTNPAGSPPGGTDHLYGATPPVATSL